MLKIAHVREIKSISGQPAPVIKVIEEVVTILDAEYGQDRDVDHGYGGYVLVPESEAELVQLKKYRIDIETAVFEYVDEILCDDGKVYVSALVLLGSDNGIVLIMPLELFNKRANKDHKLVSGTGSFFYDLAHPHCQAPVLVFSLKGFFFSSFVKKLSQTPKVFPQTSRYISNMSNSDFLPTGRRER